MSEWPVQVLADVVDCLDAVRRPVRAADRRPGPYPYYGASGVIDHVNDHLLDGTYALVAEDGENLRTRKTPIAFLARGRFWVNNHAHVLGGTAETDVRYLAYRLQHADVSGYLSGSTQPKLTQQALLSMRFRWAPIEDQRRIADVLEAIDDKIEANTSVSRLTLTLAVALYERATSDSPSATALGDVGRWLSGGTPSTSNPEYWDGDIPWISASSLKSFFVAVSHRRVTEAGARAGTKVVPKGTRCSSYGA